MPSHDDVAVPPHVAFNSPQLSHEPATGDILCASVTNWPPRSGRPTKACNARVRIRWGSVTDEGAAHGPIQACWRGASAPGIDLLPNGNAYLVEIVQKAVGENDLRVTAATVPKSP